MSRIKRFSLPDLAEGLTEGTILQWFVSPGDEVRLNQTIVEVETAKAATEVPSPYAGVVTKVHHPEGATVDVGAPLIEFDTDPGAGPLPDEPAEGGSEANGREPNLVGYGPRTGTPTRRARRGAGNRPAAPAPAPPPPSPAPVAAPPPPPPGPVVAAAVADAAVLAKPPVRKLAKDHGVDLATVTPTGPDGTITRADVEAAVTGAARPAVAAPVWDSSREQRVPIKGVRMHTAAAVSQSAFTAPHVTEFVTIDITPTMELRERVAALPDFAEVKVSPLLFVARAIILAVARNPMINSSWDEAAREIVVKEYVNLGIAAATPRGLIVPNIKDAGRLSLRELAVALRDLTVTARAGRTTPADMAGGTITITNVGVFGVDTGTPILTPGESAILAFGAVNQRPWVHEGQVVPRWVTQLALSFDHRIVDGDLGSRFLSDVAAILADPTMALAWG